MGKRVVCVLLVVCLVFSSFFNVRKAEAIAPAIPAGLGLAALAAELGITTEALCIGLGTIFVAGTGLYVAQSDGNLLWGPTSPTDVGQELNWRQEWQDGSLDLPGWDTWGDLDQESQEAYGTPRNYLQWQWNWLALQYGLLDTNGNGGLEPSEEPDPENDPNGSSKWNRMRNALIALSIGGASIPLGTVLGDFSESLGNGIKGLLFGDGNDSLQLQWVENFSTQGIGIQFLYGSGGKLDKNGPEFGASDWCYGTVYTVDPTTQCLFAPSVNGNVATGNVVLTPVGDNATKFSGQIQGVTLYYGVNTKNVRQSASGGFHVPQYKTNYVSYLNPLYSGGYTFPDATYNQGVKTGDYTSSAEYGQLSDTPQELAQNVINNNNYNNYVNNYADPGVEGYQRAITVPQGYGQSGYQPNYSDFVLVTPDGDVTPLPGDSQIPSPDPDNPVNPDTPSTEYEQDFTQKVGELLAQPFDQLFPFCLIGDLRQFLGILQEAGFGSNDQNGMRALSDEQVNGIDVLRFDLTGFNVEGAEYIEIDLTPVHDFAVGFRGIATSVFIIMLLLGTFRFFINRGGE